MHIAHKIADSAFTRGLITYPGQGSIDGFVGDHIKLAPPLTIESQTLDTIVEILYEAVISVYASVSSSAS